MPRAELMLVRPIWQWLMLLGLAVVVLVPAGFGGMWLYQAAKVWRAHGLVKEATALQAQPATAGDAASKLMAAYQLAPEDMTVLRACARNQLAAGDPHALGFYRLLISRPKATREDDRDTLRACLVFGDLHAAHELANFLTANNPEAEDYALQAQVRWQERSPEAALQIMRQALAMAPQNRTHQLLLAQMLGLSPKPEDRAEALTILRGLAQGTDAESLSALIMLSRNADVDRTTGQGILEQIRQHPLLDDLGRLAAWELERRLGTRDPEVIFKEVIDFFKSTDLARKGVAANWLYNQGKPELVLVLAAPPDSLASHDLFLVRLNALAALKRWTDVQKELEDPQVPLALPMVFLYRARAAQELGDSGGSHANWDRARAAAGSDYEMLSNLADYALKLGVYDEAKSTITLMTQFPGKSHQAYTELLQVEAQHGSSSELQATLKQMTVDLPQEPEPKNDWAYLSLLLNTNVDEAWKTAQGLVEAQPDMLAYRSTLALGYIRRNDVQGAAKVYDGLTIDWNGAPASWKMIHAVVLAANGDKARAEEAARSINRNQLRKEEMALLDTYLPGI